MKLLVCVSLAGALALSGCGDNQGASSQATNAAAPPPPRAPDNYGNTLVNAQNRAVAVVDVTSLQSAIQLFNANEGRFPKDLNELVTSRTLGQVPTPPRGKKFDYNAATGEIKLVDQ